MSDIIQLLPDYVANQIAAGEVVQRPASVIKELLENAIDAKATTISLHIKDAGRTLIQVIDNGMGMSVTDARMAFERHATSKIKTTEDIFSINTKGFRGEALASIAAVAQVELKTKLHNEEIGTQINIDGGTLVSQNMTVCASGSSIAVKNLFYNVPARRKFLKSNNIEFRHIIDEFYRVALAHNDIAFQFFHNDEEIYKLKSTLLAPRIVDVFGRRIQSLLLPISEETHHVKTSGFIGNLEMAKKTRGEQFFFVNNRFFRSNYLNKAINDAFEGLLPPKYFPSFFIFIELNPEMIDVNIHPSKTEIKFENEQDLYALIRAAVKRALGIYTLVPTLDFESNEEWQSSGLLSGFGEPKISVNADYNPFQSEKPSNNDKTEMQEFYSQAFINNENETTSETLFQPEKNIFRLNNGFWLYDKDDTLYILDLFRIHQTILYENFEKSIRGNALSQQLLFPLEYPIFGASFHKINAVKEVLFSLGFEFEIDKEMLTIDAIPSELHTEAIPTLFDALLAEMDSLSEKDFQQFFLKTASEITAMKKNQWLFAHQVTSIIDDFERLHFPLYNPFGKNNYYVLSHEELNKHFN